MVHVHFCHLLFKKQPFKNVKSILSPLTIQIQVTGQIRALGQFPTLLCLQPVEGTALPATCCDSKSLVIYPFPAAPPTQDTTIFPLDQFNNCLSGLFLTQQSSLNKQTNKNPNPTMSLLLNSIYALPPPVQILIYQVLLDLAGPHSRQST